MFPPAIDPAIHHSISSTITSTVATAMAGAQTKYDEEMLALYEMIEISLLFRESGFSTSPPNPNASSKVAPPADLPSKATEK